MLPAFGDQTAAEVKEYARIITWQSDLGRRMTSKLSAYNLNGRTICTNSLQCPSEKTLFCRSLSNTYKFFAICLCLGRWSKRYTSHLGYFDLVERFQLKLL